MLPDPRWLSPSIHPVYARLLCAELRRRGFSEAQALAGTRLDWHALHHDNGLLSAEQIQRLIVHSLQLSECLWLGFEVGRHTDVSAHGAAGVAAISAADVGSAVEVIERYALLRQDLATFTLEDGPTPCLTLDEHLVTEETRVYLLGHFTAAILRLLETLTGQPPRESIALEWPLPEPAWSGVFRTVAARYRFDAPRLRIVLPEGYLQLPCLAADPQVHRQALRDCDNQMERLARGGSLSDRIKRRLLACGQRFPTLEEMAAVEHMAVRTLIRHLHTEGMRYQTLLDEVRSDQACWLLGQTSQSIEAIAERLGYQDTSNFSRTFRRWLGVTPRQFRQQQQS